MNVFLVRHTPVVLESRACCYGWSDLELAPSFEADLADLRRRSTGLWRDPAVYSSPLSRCLKLARALVPKGGVVHQDERLKELNFGDWEGLAWDRIPRAELDAWGDDFVNRPCPGGESYLDLFTRVRSFRAETLEGDGASGDILIVSHGGVLRALLCDVLGMAPEKSFALEIDPGSISCISQNGDLPRVRFINR